MFLVSRLSSSLSLVINCGEDTTKASNLIKMFEENVKVVQNDYNAHSILKVDHTIRLGKEITFETHNYSDKPADKLIITSESKHVGCVEATSQAFLDLEKIHAEYAKQIAKLKEDLANEHALLVKAQRDLEEAQDKLAEGEIDNV